MKPDPASRRRGDRFVAARARHALIAVCLGAALFSLPPAPASGQTGAPSWPNAIYNPRPDPEDIALPMPCGGSMIFRRVVTGPSAAGPAAPLDDKQVALGSPGAEQRGYLDFRRTQYLAGAFEADGVGRYYLIGKYEVSIAQYDAVMGGEAGCASARAADAALPKGGLGWFDGIEFTRRYNGWLYAKAFDKLPTGPGGRGFVRLPDETEWEFAARGGLIVGDAERGNDLFPMGAAPLANFAWFATPESGSEPQPIGAKRPNPLGLYDVLGNVEELVLDPFRLNRVGRLHGQTGGFVARGGSIQTDEQQLTLALREEYGLFDQAERSETRRPTIGMRLVVGAAATGDFGYSRKLETAFATERQQNARPGPAARTAQAAAPAQRIDEVARRSADARLKRQLAEIGAQLQSEGARRGELEARIAKNLLMNAVLLYNELNKTALAVRVLDGEADVDPDAAKRADFRREADANVAQFKAFGTIYTDLIKQLGEDLAERIGGASASLGAELRTRGQYPTFGPTLERILRQIENFRTGARQNSRDILREVGGEGRWL